MTEIKGGVCAPKGFSAGGIRCGIKPSSSKKDLALIYSDKLCDAAAMFTKNIVKAASVQLTQKNIEGEKLRAIIANSGNANACTGEAGMDAAKRMVQSIANESQIDTSEVAVASTGVIGVPLPIDLIEKNVSVLKNSLRSDEQGHLDALEAIMTTDIRKKEIAVEIEINGVPVRIGAMAKGSGMIHPDMAAANNSAKHATMLAFVTTDAAVEKSALNSSLRNAVERSFNCTTVDGDTSTNDTIIIMANGEAANAPIATGSADYEVFSNALEFVCVSLAKMMARDGEGATKLVTVTVSGAKSEKDARIIAKSVASSSLVKAACFGADANWGRVLCAMGYSGVEFLPENVNVSFKSEAGEITVCENGGSVSFSEEKAKEILSKEEIEILISMKEGSAAASVWGCDLTYDYVKINGDYRS
ncbi:MAG: bifunctional glutamate N-acetyltransferase/amino-acid acetyltransferase ArgJ [Treponema sp.]|nr:bifunctional glutamate N-acetyltransferase/amino-acid acetyltransferase ArgJ [Treponema sp.]